MASKAESKLRLKIQKAILNKYGDTVHVFHPHGSQFSQGHPDLVGCLQGLFFALEVKMPTNRRGATKLQQAVLDEIEGAGGLAAVVTSVDEALEALDGIEE